MSKKRVLFEGWVSGKDSPDSEAQALRMQENMVPIQEAQQVRVITE